MARDYILIIPWIINHQYFKKKFSMDIIWRIIFKIQKFDPYWLKISLKWLMSYSVKAPFYLEGLFVYKYLNNFSVAIFSSVSWCCVQPWRFRQLLLEWWSLWLKCIAFIAELDSALIKLAKNSLMELWPTKTCNRSVINKIKVGVHGH